MVAVNKWDLASERGLKERRFGESVRDDLKFLPWAPVVFISAKSGRGIGTLLEAVDRVAAARTSRVTTGQLNRVIARAADLHVPRGRQGQPARQDPVRDPDRDGSAHLRALDQPRGDLHFSYKRYLENRIREAFGFEGTPIRLKVRGRRRTVRS